MTRHTARVEVERSIAARAAVLSLAGPVEKGLRAEESGDGRFAVLDEDGVLVGHLPRSLPIKGPVRVVSYELSGDPENPVRSSLRVVVEVNRRRRV